MDLNFPKKVNTPLFAITTIALLCLLVLETNQKLFKFPYTLSSGQNMHATQIESELNYIESRNNQVCFSMLGQPNKYYQTTFTPLDNNPDFNFYPQAAIGDLIHKSAYSDTVILIKKAVRYYYKIGQ